MGLTWVWVCTLVGAREGDISLSACGREVSNIITAGHFANSGAFNQNFPVVTCRCESQTIKKAEP